MPTLVQYSIGSGKTYSTIPLWEDDTDNTSLVTADEIRQGEVYDSFAVTAVLTIAGATTDATRYRRLTAAPGSSFADHANKLTNALRYNESNGVGIKTSTSYINLLDCGETGLRVDRLQLQHNGNGSGSARPFPFGCNSGIARDMIVECLGNGDVVILNSGASSKFINLLVYSKQAGGISFSYPAAGAGAFNCTVVKGSDQSTTGNGISTSGGGSTNATVKNCASFGPFTNKFNGSFNAGSGFNATDAASAPGSNNQVSLTYANQFEVVTEATRDFRAKSGNSLANGTRDQTNTNDLDIVASARSTTTPTIGAWESASSTQTFTYTGAGGITFGGAAALNRITGRTPAGGIVFAGTATPLRRTIRPVSGGIVFGGAPTISFHESTRLVAPAGGIVFGGASIVAYVGGRVIFNYILFARRRGRR